jgi:channel protein (hemolysin III family)
MENTAVYSLGGMSEPASCITHLVGAGVFALLALALLRRGRGDWGRIVVLGIFAYSAVLLLVVSGLYHLCPPRTISRTVLWRLDHCAIFILIAGTFTPVHGILFRGASRWVPLVLIWSAAAAGIGLSAVLLDRSHQWVSLVSYISLGWMGAISGIALWRLHGFPFVTPLVFGGAAYTLGAVLESLHWPTPIPGVFGPHELWHVAVLVGIGLHWKFIDQFATGEERPRAAAWVLAPPAWSLVARHAAGVPEGADRVHPRSRPRSPPGCPPA